MSNDTVCRQFYTGPNCDQTYAQFFGSAFDATQYIYIAITVVVTLYVTVQTVILYRARGLQFPLNAQSKMFFFANIVCVTLIIRAVDPFAWRTWLPATVVFLAYDVGTSAIYSELLVLVYDWMRITLFFTPGFREWLPFLGHIFTVLHVVVWVQFNVFSILQTNVIWWVFRACKLAIGAAVLFTLISLQAGFGVSIFRTLKSNEASMGANRESRNFPLTSGQQNKNSISVPLSASKDNGLEESVSNADERNRSNTQGRVMRANTQRRRTRINRILQFLAWATVFELVAMAFQIVFVIGSVSSKQTTDHWDTPPKTNGDIIIEAIFDIIQAVVALFGTFFFRHKDSGDDSSKSETDSQIGRRATRAAPAPTATKSRESTADSLPSVA